MSVKNLEVLNASLVLFGSELLSKPAEREIFHEKVDTEVITGPNVHIGNPPEGVELEHRLVLNRDRISLALSQSRTVIQREYPLEPDLDRLAAVAGIAIVNTEQVQEPRAFGYSIDLVYDQESENRAFRYLAHRLFAPKIPGNDDWRLVGGAGKLILETDGQLWNITVEPRFNNRDSSKIFLSMNLHKDEQYLPRSEEIKRSLQETWQQAHNFVHQLDEQE